MYFVLVGIRLSELFRKKILSFEVYSVIDKYKRPNRNKVLCCLRFILHLEMPLMYRILCQLTFIFYIALATCLIFLHEKNTACNLYDFPQNLSFSFFLT